MMREPVVIYEDNHLIAINKPAGMLVQGDETGDYTLTDWVKDYIKVRYHKPGDVFLGVIHRLDRPVSGVVLMARTSKGLIRMNEMFAERKVTKTYWAITSRQPDPLIGHLEHLIEKDPATLMGKAYPPKSKQPSKAAKLAILDYEMVAQINDKYLIEVKPETGRHHQIRVQLAKIGCPIRNDVKYGGELTGRDKGKIYLHAYSLSFEHPVTKEQISFKAQLPSAGDDIWRLFGGHQNQIRD
jgi:23S rRNA pseudouridine1911/1915/1917 synthase